MASPVCFPLRTLGVCALVALAVLQGPIGATPAQAQAAPTSAQASSGAPRSAPFPTLEAQSSFTPSAVPRPRPWPTPAERRAEYDRDAQELAFVMGAAHYLRWLCVGRRDQFWRDFMGQLLEREDQRLRTGMAEAFNRGFDAERLRFDRCGARALTAETEWKAKGLKLADSLAARNRD